MGNYQRVAEAEMLRREKGLPPKVDFDPVVYGEEKRCPKCWTLLSERELDDGKTVKYCFSCSK
jgi:hypothetical protein